MSTRVLAGRRVYEYLFSPCGRQRLKGLAGLLAPVLALALGVWSTLAGLADPDSPARSEGPVSQASCPLVRDDGMSVPRATRTGRLVPEGATTAILCTYAHQPDGGDQLPLATMRALASDPTSLVTELNRLHRAPDGLDICVTMGGDQQLIVLGYPDREPAVVRMSNCATVDQGGAVRRVTSLKSLLNPWGID